MDAENWTDVCLVCGERFFSEKDLADHVKNVHMVTKHDCPFCPYQSDKLSDLERHIDSIHAQEMLTPGKKNVADEPTSSVSEIMQQNGHGAESDGGVEMLSCPVCDGTKFPSLNSLNEHIECHFLEGKTDVNCANDELMAIRIQKQEDYISSLESRKAAENLQFEELRDSHGMGQKHQGTGFKKQALKNMAKAVGRMQSSTFDYFSNKLNMLEKLEEGIDDGITTLPDVFDFLQKHLNETVKPGQRVWLSSPTYFIGRGPGDAGWGCGYRNVQMMISSLNKHPLFADVMKSNFHGQIPSIPKLQKMIEASWSKGYDVRGKEQLESNLVGTRKWVGATEVFALFASLGLHCRILDFPSPSGGEDNMHPLLIDWVQQYFKKEIQSRKVCVTAKPPLYLQHEGHSRSIIGITCDEGMSQSTSRQTKSPTKLVLFDPGISKFEALTKDKKGKKQKYANSKQLCFNKFVKPLSCLNEEQFQVVCVEGIATPQRNFQQKDVDSLCEKIVHRSC